MRWIVGATIALSVTLGPVAVAAGAEPSGDRAIAEQILAELGRVAADRAPLVANASAEAKRALGRAKGARDAGDRARAELLEGVAREWSELGRDLLRAAQTESEAVAAEQSARAADQRSERGRSLLEETIARQGEAAAQLEQRMQSPTPSPRRTLPERKGPTTNRAPSNSSTTAVQPAASSIQGRRSPEPTPIQPAREERENVPMTPKPSKPMPDTEPSRGRP